jgi:hypothetical protein
MIDQKNLLIYRFPRSIIELSAARFAAGIAAGLDPDPWTDMDRDFIGEGLEEAADGRNYVLMLMARGFPKAAFVQLLHARKAFADAFESLKAAAAIIADSDGEELIKIDFNELEIFECQKINGGKK